MPEFLRRPNRMKLISLNIIVEFVPAITSLGLFVKLRSGKLRTLPVFLTFIFVVELMSRWLRISSHNNNWIYNLSVPIEYSYYLYLFRLHGQKRLSLVASLGLVLLSATFGVCLLLKPFTIFYDPVVVVGDVSVIVSSCFYVYQVFEDDADQHLNLLQHYFFWLAAGLLLFTLGDFCFFGLFPFILTNKLDQHDYLFKAINNNLLILLNVCYLISLFVYLKYHRAKHA
jgi:hypothetical protein